MTKLVQYRMSNILARKRSKIFTLPNGLRMSKDQMHAHYPITKRALSVRLLPYLGGASHSIILNKSSG